MSRFGRLVRGVVLAAPLTLSCDLASASDPWEPDAGEAGGFRILRLGEVESGRDLEGTVASPDVDLFAVECQEGHSYQARVTQGAWWTDDTCGPLVFCGTFNLIDVFDTVAVPGAFDPAASVKGMAVRWVWTDPTDLCKLRARGAGPSDTPSAPVNAQYQIEVLDTTVFVPRWNNSGTQVTVFAIQNTTSTAVTGSVYFYSSAGALLFTQPLSLPASGGQVFNTASISALAGQSGVANIVHLGAWGALAGKAVAVEPATGFTFDTPFVTQAR